ncbi:Por secretion system C-terminal sorting domain-containing protein [Flaviramulus basaltis]|uniref:Por secretion system C-terminal sorting domain-containing protein n=1 Tax=Flaviramulus basaltis TaxID=369401 RepID=A0A1K2ICJ3_9FLAO|nr:M4 family metallopeptidase [Flaviramulus basaltis]SFZ90000.1 Por secretion system C-terminal sorting domain-containing protein [Flaviramulus basaltis]
MNKKITFLIAFALFSIVAIAQQPNKIKNLKFEESSNYRLSDAKQVIKNQLKLSSDNDLTKIQSETDKLGITHEKYQQYIKGVKVEFATYTVHAKNGKIKTMTGELFSAGKLDLSPKLSNVAAFNKALNYIGAQKYLWESPKEAKIMDNYKKPSGELLIFPGEIIQQNKARLVYKFDMYATKPISRDYIYVDAHSGEVVFKNPIIKHLDKFEGNNLKKASKKTVSIEDVFATGTAATRYSGSQAIETTSSGGNYVLRGSSRGNGIETYNMEMRINYNSAIDFTDNDNNWTAAEHNNADKDNAALDAHWGAEKTYDYFMQTFNRNSYDNNGAAIKSYVHFDLVEYGYSNQDNAFWNGSVMTYGDGTSFDPLTSIDIAAHEIGHAVCENTANLVYSYQSGAMNEGFSDIWAASVEYYADPTKSTWVLGEEIGGPIRSLSNPKAHGQPDTYLGTNWYTGSGDSGGVHYNSGVLNHWFYILTVGKNGTNDNSDSYSVVGIGIDKAAAIAYRLESVYLSSNSQYSNARTSGIQAAEDLYGINSAEVIATTNAFYAVGIGSEFVQTCALNAPTSLAASSISDNSLTANWTAVSGAVAYNITIGGTTTTVSGTSYTSSGLLPGTTYSVSVVANCSTGGSGTSSSISVTTTGTAPLSYCDSASTNINDEYIGRVQLGTINNASSGQFYSDFTSISTDLTKGDAYTITVTPTWTGTVYNEGYSVWIDYNQDGDFGDSGEQVWSQSATSTTPVSGTFTVSSSAINGTTRMRVSMKYNGVPTSCETFNYGEVEDYTVNLGDGTPTPDTTPPVITLNGASTIILTVGDTYTELGATATDNVDGNLTSSIVTSGTVNTNSEGTYTVTYSVSDAAGNLASANRTIVVNEASSGSTTVLHEGFFESGWDGWSDGGSDVARYSGSRSYEGSYSIQLRDNSGTASAMTSQSFNLTQYDTVEVQFYFYAYSMENGEDFWLRYYNGSTWTTVAAYASGTSFNNNTFYTATVTLDATNYNFASNAQFRFQCDASNNSDYIYIDQVTIKGIIGSGFAPNSISPLGSGNSGFASFSVEPDNFEGDFRLYPNPTKNILNIQVAGEELIAYRIVNLLGQTVKQGQLTEKEINISNLQLGMYIIEVNDGDEIMTKRFIKE